MSVLNNANKQMLIELCGTQGISIDDDFQTFFERLCNDYNNNRLEYNNIQEINKQILADCFYYSQKKIEALSNQQVATQQEPARINQYNSMDNMELKTLDSKDLRIQKDSDFTMKLKSREEAFQTLIQKPAPQKVSFEDKEQDLPSANLEVLMNQSLADREKELKQILNNKTTDKAREWLKPIETSDKPKQEKKVRFQQDDRTMNDKQDVANLLSKLKPKSNENTEIINLLKKVLENQENVKQTLNEVKQRLDELKV